MKEKVTNLQKDFNLLISCPRFHEREALAEVWYLYSNIGDDEVRGEPVSFPGLVVAKTKLDPILSIGQLKNIINDDNSYLRFVLKIIPIERVLETSLDDIIKTVQELMNRIKEDESFRIRLKTRFSPFNSQELIVKVASYIDRKVDLTNPDKILMLQILGTVTGISILKPDDILYKAEFIA